MWMMGYNDGGEFNLGDSFNGRKLRPLVPRPAPTSTSPCNNIISGGDIHCLSRIHGTHDLFALNHHLAVAEQSKRDFNAQQVVVSSRWNPTPEQLQTLEELYRRGTRTPNADEIQHITAQLRRYGKIEGKNVFYWFQNHKARERQKRRRQLETVPERKDSGGVNRTGYEVEQTKNWGNPTNCTSTFSEKSVSMEGGAGGKAGCRGAEVGWIHFEEEGDQQHTLINNFAERNATWHMMNLSCSSSSSSSSSPAADPTTLLINTTTTTTTTNNNNTLSLPPPPPPTTTTVITSSTTSPSTVRSSFTTMDHIPYSNLYFLKPEDLARYVTVGNNIHNNDHGEESQTLELFPLRSSGGADHGNGGVKEAEIDFPAITNTNNHLGRPARQFFEFLPLKN